MTTTTRYPNLEAFYAGDERRRRSGEADYGVWWTNGGARWPWWRVSYVQDTGEVYAVKEYPAGELEVLGIVPADHEVPAGSETDDGTYFPRGGTYYRTLDRILEGWSDGAKDVSWVRGRLRGLGGT